MRSRGKATRWVLQFAMAALLLRALVPAGFMAAPLADGWPLQLCPAGMSMSSFMALLDGGEGNHSAHSAHAEHADDEPDPACGLGSAYSAVAVALTAAPGTADIVAAQIPVVYATDLPRAPPRAHRSRAPPHSFLSVS